MNTGKKTLVGLAVLFAVPLLMVLNGPTRDEGSASGKLDREEVQEAAVEPGSQRMDAAKEDSQSPHDPQLAESVTKEETVKAPSGASSVEELKAIVLDKNRTPDFRREALAVLTEAGPEAIPLLVEIAVTDVPKPKDVGNPHSAEVRLFEFEKGLRFTALEAIDEWGTRDFDVRPALKSILQKSRDQDIRFMAFVSLKGVEQGRPGKLTRLIDRMFEEFEAATR